jgi:hypothetical protein
MSVRSFVNLRSLEQSAAPGAEVARGLATDQSTSAIAKNPSRLPGKFGILELDHNAVLATTPASILKLLVD